MIVKMRKITLEIAYARLPISLTKSSLSIRAQRIAQRPSQKSSVPKYSFSSGSTISLLPEMNHYDMPPKTGFSGWTQMIDWIPRIARSLVGCAASSKNRTTDSSWKCLCLPDQDTGSSTIVDHVRVFPNREKIRWKFRIHEQILPSLLEQGGEVVWTDVVIQHVGISGSPDS